MPSLLPSPRAITPVSLLREGLLGLGAEPQGTEGRKVHEAAADACRHWQQGKAYPDPLVPSAAELIAYRHFVNAMHQAGRDIVSFSQRLLRGDVQASASNLMGLADEAARQCAKRSTEDVRAWAERLSQDVQDAVD